jgi:hypothetical protein
MMNFFKISLLQKNFFLSFHQFRLLYVFVVEQVIFSNDLLNFIVRDIVAFLYAYFPHIVHNLLPLEIVNLFFYHASHDFDVV